MTADTQDFMDWEHEGSSNISSLILTFYKVNKPNTTNILLILSCGELWTILEIIKPQPRDVIYLPSSQQFILNWYFFGAELSVKLSRMVSTEDDGFYGCGFFIAF